jgi:hypothetical protein
MVGDTEKLRRMPHTVPHAIDQIGDVQRLRDLAVGFWAAMWGQHELVGHVLAADCAECRTAAEAGDPRYACGQYHASAARFQQATRSV